MLKVLAIVLSLFMFQQAQAAEPASAADFDIFESIFDQEGDVEEAGDENLRGDGVFTGNWSGTGKASNGETCQITLTLDHYVKKSLKISNGVLDCPSERKTVSSITAKIGADGTLTYSFFRIGTLKGNKIRIAAQGKKLNADLDGDSVDFFAADGADTIEGTLTR